LTALAHGGRASARPVSFSFQPSRTECRAAAIEFGALESRYRLDRELGREEWQPSIWRRICATTDVSRSRFFIQS
jgi:hypothetical protein